MPARRMAMRMSTGTNMTITTMITRIMVTAIMTMTIIMATITTMRITAMIMITAITSTATIIAMSATEAFPELPLLLWLSPAFPVGSFAYSHGLEWAVEAGDVTDAVTLRAWVDDLLRYGAPRNDAILFARAFAAAAAQDRTEIGQLNELAVALAGSAERRLETSAQGGSFLAAMRSAWPSAAFDLAPAETTEIAYPVAVALAAAGHGLPLESSLQAFVLALIANLVSAAVRLGPIGQSDGQRVLAALLHGVKRLAAEAAGASLDDLGGCALRSDIAAMRHETQYSRLFRS